MLKWEKHIGELCEMPVEDLQQWFAELMLVRYDRAGVKILTEINHRIKTLLDVWDWVILHLTTQ